MTDHEHITQIEKARKDLISSYKRLLNTYFFAIKDRYEGASVSDKERILKGLEAIALGREIPFKPIEPFNGKRAAEIRKNLDMTQEDLAKKTGLSLSIIAKYEKEKRIPSYPLSEKANKYMHWLSENGYNPYNIDFSH